MVAGGRLAERRYDPGRPGRSQTGPAVHQRSSLPSGRSLRRNARNRGRLSHGRGRRAPPVPPRLFGRTRDAARAAGALQHQACALRWGGCVSAPPLFPAGAPLRVEADATRSVTWRREMRPQAVDDAEATARRAIADRLPALGLADLRVVLGLVEALDERDFGGGLAATRSYAGRLFERSTGVLNGDEPRRQGPVERRGGPPVGRSAAGAAGAARRAGAAPLPHPDDPEAVA